MKSDITEAEWKALYRAAAAFREIEPWAWVTEEDIFGVQNPLTGEIGYCCVMGEMGEVLGMAVYLGTSGLNGYRLLRDGTLSPEDSDAMFVQDCILVSFENKSSLDSEDKALIKKLGIQARGKRAWPMFRRHEPGFFPWFPGKADIVFMTAVLEQAKDVCLRIRKDEDLLSSPKEGAYLIRTYNADKSLWEDAWMMPKPLPERVLLSAKPDELALQRIKKSIRPSQSAWEIDTFYSPAPVFDRERPVYPYTILIADKDDGYLHDAYLSDHAKAPSEFVGRLLSCIEKSSICPGEILVKRQETADLLSAVAEKLEIRLNLVDRLPSVDEARRSMEKDLLKKAASAGPAPDDGDDYRLEGLLEKAGSELSIFGLYGLIYGCLAAPELVMPSVLMHVIFGKEGAAFGSEAQVEETIGSVMALWNRLSQWDAAKQVLIIPEMEYPLNSDGALHRCADAIDFVSLFMEGLELGGFGAKALSPDLIKDIDQLEQVADLLSAQVNLLQQLSRPGRKEIEDTMQALEKAEYVIDGCITDICRELKETRLLMPKQGADRQMWDNVVPFPDRVKTGRNNPCPCGSGKKYKKCCGLVH